MAFFQMAEGAQQQDERKSNLKQAQKKAKVSPRIKQRASSSSKPIVAKSDSSPKGGSPSLGAKIQAAQQIQSAISGDSGSTSAGEGAISGALSGASAGAAFGPTGAAIGGGVGALVGVMKSRSARKRRLGDIEAKKQQQLSQIEGQRVQNINAALSNLGSQFSASLLR